MKLFIVLLFVLILVKMNYSKKHYFQKTNKWSIEDHVLLDKELKETSKNITIIAKNLNKTIEETKEQIKEFIYLIYTKTITKSIVKNTGFREEEILDIINEKNPLKREIDELKQLLEKALPKLSFTKT
jgi:hypothetical protein